MSDDEVARRERAEELRRRLREGTGPEPDPDPAEVPGESASGESTPEMLPGESPNDYVQRRMRELDRERPRPG